jgi:hypothetical protein
MLISRRAASDYNPPRGRVRKVGAAGTMGGDRVNRTEILQKLQAGELGIDEANKLLAEADEKKRGSLYCKVSQKGAISVYGLQRMPVTLYVEQWERLIAFTDEIRQFSTDHAGELSRKNQT